MPALRETSKSRAGSCRGFAPWWVLILLLIVPACLNLVAQTVRPPAQAVALNKRGEELLATKEYEAAAENFRKALAIHPDYPEALVNLGKALEAQGEDDEAVTDFQKAIKLAPDDAIAYNEMGHALFHEKKYEESVASYRKAISIHDNYAEAYNGLGAALLSMGKTEEAIAALENAAKLDPKNADALTTRARRWLANSEVPRLFPIWRRRFKSSPMLRTFWRITRTRSSNPDATRMRLPLVRKQLSISLTIRAHGRPLAIPSIKRSDTMRRKQVFARALI